MTAGGIIITDIREVIGGIDGQGGIPAEVQGRVDRLRLPVEWGRRAAGTEGRGGDGLIRRLIIAEIYDLAVGAVQVPVNGILSLDRIQAGGAYVDLPGEPELVQPSLNADGGKVAWVKGLIASGVGAA